MKEEEWKRANSIMTEWSNLKLIKDRVDNNGGHFKISFGVSINSKLDPFCPIYDESLNKKLQEITKEHCDKKMAELQKQFDEV